MLSIHPEVQNFGDEDETNYEIHEVNKCPDKQASSLMSFFHINQKEPRQSVAAK